MIWGYPILGTPYSKSQKNRIVKYTGKFSSELEMTIYSQ